MKMLWAVKKGNEAWQEEIITTNEAVIEQARIWAKANGFDRFRIVEYKDGERPNFVKAINQGKSKREG